MTMFQKCFMWLRMLTKRLLHQWSFVLLLCLIPVSILLTSLAVSQESGVVHILLCNESGDPAATEIVNRLMDEDSVVRFSRCDSAEQARQTVADHRADAAWIFPADFAGEMDRYVQKPASSPLVQIIQREESVTLQIANEKLFGALAREFSYAIYKDFVYSNVVSEQTVSEETVRGYFDQTGSSGGVVNIRQQSADKSGTGTSTSYLTAPLRGILSLMVVLCTVAATMYYLREQREGKFAWLPVNRRIVPAFASCLSAALLSGLAVLITLCLAGLSVNLLRELVCMLLFVLSVTGFCTILALVFRSPGKLGAAIPGLMIVMLVLSPIFFNPKELKAVRLMLPTYYYLQSVYNLKYMAYCLVYGLSVCAISLLLNAIVSNRRHPNSIE